MTVKISTRKNSLFRLDLWGPKDDWHGLRIAWRKCLKKNGIEYFKTSEFKMLNGEFLQFRKYPVPEGREIATAIRDKLHAILRRHSGIRAVGVALPVDDFERVCARPEGSLMAAPLAYQRALEGVLFETVNMIRALPGTNTVAFVHDDGTDFDALRHCYNGFLEADPKTAKFMAGFLPLNDKEHPPLQLADMIANLTLEIGMEWIANGRTPRGLKQMQDNIGMIGVWDEHYMLSILKRNLTRFGKPIPLDLQAGEYG
jgi:hypothetical protein